MKIAVIGGAGALGGGLAWRWARAGHDIIIGSREAGRAAAAAAELVVRSGGGSVTGCDNIAAAAEADLVVVTVPFSVQRATLESIRAAVGGKIVIDATVGLNPPKVGTVQLPPEGSAGMVAFKVLGAEVTLVSAFQNVSADLLASDNPLDCDVLICGNDAAACATVAALAADAGMRGFHAGPIQNSAATEALTSILITLNRKYRGSHAGISITGLAEAST